MANLQLDVIKDKTLVSTIKLEIPIKKPKAKLCEQLLWGVKFDFTYNVAPNKVDISKGTMNPVNM